MQHFEQVRKQMPIFNGRYHIEKQIGQGNTSKVYLGHAVDSQQQPAKVAIKILKADYIMKSESNLQSFKSEIAILKQMDHVNIIKLVSYGSDGYIVKPSGRRLQDLVYLVMEFVDSHLLFDVCKSNQAMGEDVGRYFAHQMMDVMEYMQSKRVCHRDLKLENILFDKNANVKIADFGFAVQK